MDACPTRFDLQGPGPGARHHVRVCPRPEDLARQVAQDFAATVRAAIAAHGEAHVVLAGGNTPREAYRRMAQLGPDFPWDRVHVYWTDERAVPPEHPRSNYRMVRETLLDAVPIPRRNVHRVPAERPPHEAAQAYAEILARLPRPMDWVLLGLGADGHTASLFPGTPALRETARPVVAVYVPSLGEWRITLTYPVFNRARRVGFLVMGEGKAPVVRQVLLGPYRPEQWPAQAIHPPQPVVWWLDAEAARELMAGLHGGTVPAG